MRRWCFNFLAASCAALLLLLAIDRGSHRWRYNTIEWSRVSARGDRVLTHSLLLTTGSGEIQLGYMTADDPFLVWPSARNDWGIGYRWGRPPLAWKVSDAPLNRLGFAIFGWSKWNVDRGANSQSIEFPHWFAALLLLPAPLTWWTRHRRLRMRPREGRCLACGYDLRESPHRCPECGAAPEHLGLGVPPEVNPVALGRDAQATSE